jgi:hypothetical protein
LPVSLSLESGEHVFTVTNYTGNADAGVAEWTWRAKHAADLWALRFWQIDGSAWRIGVDVSPRRDCLAARLLGFGNGAAPVGSIKVAGKKFDRFEVVTFALNTDSEFAPGALGHQGRDLRSSRS